MQQAFRKCPPFPRHSRKQGLKGSPEEGCPSPTASPEAPLTTWLSAGQGTLVLGRETAQGQPCGRVPGAWLLSLGLPVSEVTAPTSLCLCPGLLSPPSPPSPLPLPCLVLPPHPCPSLSPVPSPWQEATPPPSPIAPLPPPSGGSSETGQ